tara:strand:+ start:9620 stop:9814 length:195 start_codon:yes stop_codon:yes gene_type:complete
MEELTDRLNGCELIIIQHEERDEKVKYFLHILGKILDERNQLASSILNKVEIEYEKLLEALEGI